MDNQKAVERVQKLKLAAVEGGVTELFPEDAEALETLLAEIDRLRVELRKARDKLMPLILSIFSKPSDEVAWQAESDKLCGPEKGGEG